MACDCDRPSSPHDTLANGVGSIWQWYGEGPELQPQPDTEIHTNFLLVLEYAKLPYHHLLFDNAHRLLYQTNIIVEMQHNNHRVFRLFTWKSQNDIHYYICTISLICNAINCSISANTDTESFASKHPNGSMISSKVHSGTWLFVLSAISIYWRGVKPHNTYTICIKYIFASSQFWCVPSAVNTDFISLTLTIDVAEGHLADYIVL